MNRFYVRNSQIEGKFVFIEGTDVNHMKNVLRLMPGDHIEVSDGEGVLYTCAVAAYQKGIAQAEILSSRLSDTELGARLILFQGLPKKDKMDLIVEKAVELGASTVYPVETARSVEQVHDPARAEKKLDRWQRIAESAAKQSKRGVIPEVHAICSFGEMLQEVEKLDICLIPYELAEDMKETDRVILRCREIVKKKPNASIGIVIGPEGGFEEEEVRKAAAAGAVPVTLGRRILRTETAGLAALSILMYELEDRAE